MARKRRPAPEENPRKPVRVLPGQTAMLAVERLRALVLTAEESARVVAKRPGPEYEPLPGVTLDAPRRAAPEPAPLLSRLLTPPPSAPAVLVASEPAPEPPPLTERERKISDLVGAIALAQDAAQDAEDRENLSRASKIRAQARELESELRALQAAPATPSPEAVLVASEPVPAPEPASAAAAKDPEEFPAPGADLARTLAPLAKSVIITEASRGRTTGWLAEVVVADVADDDFTSRDTFFRFLEPRSDTLSRAGNGLKYYNVPKRPGETVLKAESVYRSGSLHRVYLHVADGIVTGWTEDEDDARGWLGLDSVRVRREKADAQARERSEAWKLPALAGSDKQIAWAAKIRDGALSTIRANAPELAVAVSAVRTAREWIDNREDPAMYAIRTWVRAAQGGDPEVQMQVAELLGRSAVEWGIRRAQRRDRPVGDADVNDLVRLGVDRLSQPAIRAMRTAFAARVIERSGEVEYTNNLLGEAREWMERMAGKEQGIDRPAAPEAAASDTEAEWATRAERWAWGELAPGGREFRRGQDEGLLAELFLERDPAWQRLDPADQDAARRGVLRGATAALAAPSWTNVGRALAFPLAARIPAAERRMRPESLARRLAGQVFEAIMRLPSMNGVRRQFESVAGAQGLREAMEREVLAGVTLALADADR
jgi:hypothetical protein